MPRFLFFCAGFLFVLSVSLPAHPHTFISVQTGVEFNSDGTIAGIWEHWEFDEMFSTWAIEESDVNRDGQLNEAEQKLVFKNYFSNVAQYGYFLYFQIGDARVIVKEVENFSTQIHKGKIAYKFFVPLAKYYLDQLVFSIFDPTFFCAITHVTPKPVYFVQAPELVAYKIVKNTKNPVYYNPFGAPDDQTVYTKWQKGLQTAYPQEIVIYKKSRSL